MGKVVVDIHGGQKLLIDLCDTEEQFKTITVLQLKEKICEHTGWPGNLITLKFITEKTLLNSMSLQGWRLHWTCTGRTSMIKLLETHL
uniref:Ubiquitin-like domain-containing protein n=1 Tax=Amphiprion percula TaxID=161767 RepID=A0A3P8SC72_AMPPE